MWIARRNVDMRHAVGLQFTFATAFPGPWPRAGMIDAFGVEIRQSGQNAPNSIARANEPGFTINACVLWTHQPISDRINTRDFECLDPDIRRHQKRPKPKPKVQPFFRPFSLQPLAFSLCSAPLAFSGLSLSVLLPTTLRLETSVSLSH
jgi:hypothetical protein